MPKPKHITEYRKYDLDSKFPVMLLLDGKQWEISDTLSDRLHFHNCMEIGVCLKGSGYMKFRGEDIRFHEGDVTVIPENIPHTTCSDSGTSSYWLYLMFNPWGFFKGILPITNKDYNLTNLPLENFQLILSREDYPLIWQLARAAITELKEKRTGYDVSAKGLLLALYIEIYRAETAAVTASDTPAPTTPLLRKIRIQKAKPEPPRQVLTTAWSSPPLSIISFRIICSSFPFNIWRSSAT